MTEPRKPQDRKPKADAVRTVEVDGMTIEVDPKNLDVNALELIEEDKFISGMKAIVGPGQFAAWKTVAADEDGKVSMEKLQDFVEVVMGALGN